MLNQVFQLVRPKNIMVKYEDDHINSSSHILIRPTYMSICHADQRYYQGKRDPSILAKKLPMALIHEASGIVVSDPTNTYQVGQKVVMIPNSPPRESNEYFYENYMKGTYFRSSGYDGFMKEIVSLPVDRVVAFDNIQESIAVLAEFVSVAVHAVDRFDRISHCIRDTVAIIGDGSLSYVTANVLNYLFPNVNLIVIGRNQDKLNMFNFVDKTYLTNELPESLEFDHAFECCGGIGSENAIDDIIKYINPQGTIILMGVSDNKVLINTRDTLEKGLIVVGSSRSGRSDFEKTIKIMQNEKIKNRLKNIICSAGTVESIEDIYKVFELDLSTPFKTVFEWKV